MNCHSERYTIQFALDIDDCSGNPCNHGTCHDGIATFSCSCKAGYTGSHCDRSNIINNIFFKLEIFI